MEGLNWSRAAKVGLGGLLVGLAVSRTFAVDQYDTLTAGETVYRNVVVRSQNASSLIVTHAGGFGTDPIRKTL